MSTIAVPPIPKTIFDPQLPLFDTPTPRAPLALEAKPYVAPAEQLPLWHEPRSVAMTQEPSDRTPDAAGDGNGNCGPTSAAMALRLIGLDVPGFHGERTQKAIDAARMIATGANDANDWTNVDEMRKVFDAAGATSRQADGVNDVLSSVRDGKVALVLGNVNTTGWPGGSHVPPTYGKDEWSGHFVVASRYYPDRDAYAINDPGDPRPYFVTADQLRRFATGGDGENINAGKYALILDGPALDIRPATVRRGDHAWGAATYEPRRERLGDVFDRAAGTSAAHTRTK